MTNSVILSFCDEYLVNSKFTIQLLVPFWANPDDPKINEQIFKCLHAYKICLAKQQVKIKKNTCYCCCLLCCFYFAYKQVFCIYFVLIEQVEL